MEVHILIGLPASGKSTFGKDFILSNPNSTMISSDSIRFKLFGDEATQGDPAKVFEVLYKKMENELTNGYTVVIDATNINVRDRSKAIQIAKKYKANVIGHVMKTPIAECIRRNDKRKRKVPDYVYDNMIRKYEPPTLEEGFDEIKGE